MSHALLYFCGNTEANKVQSDGPYVFQQPPSFGPPTMTVGKHSIGVQTEPSLAAYNLRVVGNLLRECDMLLRVAWACGAMSSELIYDTGSRLYRIKAEINLTDAHLCS